MNVIIITFPPGPANDPDHNNDPDLNNDLIFLYILLDNSLSKIFA